MNLFLISGLAADERVFARLALPPRHRLRHVAWLPFEPGEGLPAYASRLAAAIDTREPYALAGLSMGGMLTAELAERLKPRPRRALLISSAASRSELPPYLRAMGRLRLNRVVPPGLLRLNNPLLWWLLGIRTAEDKALFNAMIAQWTPGQRARAVNAILSWPRRERPPELMQIHGDCDHTLPLRRTQADHVIAGAGHLMVHTHAAEVTAWITRVLDEAENEACPGV